VPRISLVEELTSRPVPPGSQLLVEFDSTSIWFSASLNIAAGWLRTGGRLAYNVGGQPPQDLRSQLRQIEPNIDDYEMKEKLKIYDLYSTTLGRKSTEKYALESLKVADLSLRMSREFHTVITPGSDSIEIVDDLTVFARFNDEKNWVEWELTRDFAAYKMQKVTNILGLIKGVQSEWAYKRLEAASDGVIDFKVDEVSDPPRNLIRIRSMRNVHFDPRWHQLKVGENFEVTLEKT
jgi:KaiC/GvpD/RAD55 family RecA-like ATPase